MTIENLIKEKINELSSGQKKVAEYILQNYESFSYMTLAKLSKEIEVSETTIIRLSYSLGFENFSGMQQKVRQEILAEPQRSSEEVLMNGNYYQKLMNKEISALENWASHIDESAFERFTDILLDANQILIVGARSSYNAAAWLGGVLSRILGNVAVIQEFYDSRMELLTDITEQSVVLCITFARYTKWSYTYTEIAKKRGAKVLGVTDSIISPVSAISDEMIVVDSYKNEMGFNSCVCLYFFFNSLIARIQDKKRVDISSRLKKLEEVYADLDMFFE